VVRTALNAGASWWRRRARELPLAGRDVAAPGSPGSGLDTVVLSALRRLPARQREVIVLRVLLDLDLETTATQLAIAPGTVRAHLFRAVTALRNELAHAAAASEAVYWLGPFQNYKTFCPYLVGDHASVAAELARYLELGFSTFILDIPTCESDLEHTAAVFDEAMAGRRS